MAATKTRWKVGGGGHAFDFSRSPKWAQELRAERVKQGLSLQTLADKLGYDIITVGNWERGYQTPTVLSFIDWLTGLGLEMKIQPQRRDKNV